ncbi:MAG: hypothetical protein QOG88_1428, partial [Actinomycetota bacterium]|nr:hypothetical protein [Actinomycetota bacterium]
MAGAEGAAAPPNDTAGPSPAKFTFGTPASPRKASSTSKYSS